MHDLLVDNLKLAKRNLTKDLLSRLMFLGVGTNEVENYAQRVSRQNVRRGRNVRMVRDMMRNKLDDARFDERQVRRMFVRSKILYRKTVQRGSYTDMEFHRVLPKIRQLFEKDGS